jgi:hypothetical protein
MLIHLANISYRTGRTLYFDPVTYTCKGDPEATAMFTRAQYRSPFAVPNVGGTKTEAALTQRIAGAAGALALVIFTRLPRRADVHHQLTCGRWAGRATSQSSPLPAISVSRARGTLLASHQRPRRGLQFSMFTWCCASTFDVADDPRVVVTDRARQCGTFPPALGTALDDDGGASHRERARARPTGRRSRPQRAGSHKLTGQRAIRLSSKLAQPRARPPTPFDNAGPVVANPGHHQRYVHATSALTGDRNVRGRRETPNFSETKSG